jgi:hypothetical protein
MEEATTAAAAGQVRCTMVIRFIDALRIRCMDVL